MAEQNLEPRWRTPHPHFAWVPLTPPPPPPDDQLPPDVRPEPDIFRPPFTIFLVRVKSDTDVGREEHNDPLPVYRRFIDEIEFPEDTRVFLLRSNAEIPANPVHKSKLYVKVTGSTTLIGIEYKDRPDRSEAT